MHVLKTQSGCNAYEAWHVSPFCRMTKMVNGLTPSLPQALFRRRNEPLFSLRTASPCRRHCCHFSLGPKPMNADPLGFALHSHGKQGQRKQERSCLKEALLKNARASLSCQVSYIAASWLPGIIPSSAISSEASGVLAEDTAGYGTSQRLDATFPPYTLLVTRSYPGLLALLLGARSYQQWPPTHLSTLFIICFIQLRAMSFSHDDTTRICEIQTKNTLHRLELILLCN